jgi:hypothetical protein
MRRIADCLRLCAALTPLIGVLLTGIAAGQSTLRWKFRSADHFEIVTAQDVKITAEVDKDSMRVSHRTVVQIDWKVSSVDPHGQATIAQKIERLKVQLKSPGMDELVYDSAKGRVPTGPVKEVAETLQPLLKTGAKLKVDSRGQVHEVRLNSESSRINAPGGQPFRQFLIAGGGLELSGLNYLVLPKGRVTAGGRWNHTAPVQLGMGTFQRETTYQLAESRKRGDRLLPTVSLSWKLAPQAETEPALPGEPEHQQPVRIENQKNEGTFLFDVDAGYAVEASLQQHMTVISQAASREVKQQIISSTKLTMRRLNAGTSRATR